jgi:hypothetical protein
MRENRSLLVCWGMEIEWEEEECAHGCTEGGRGVGVDWDFGK